MTGTTLGDSNLTGANLSQSNLTNSNIDGTPVSGADLAGATLTQLHTSGLTGVPSALPENWSLINGYLLGPSANLGPSVNLSGADLAGVDLAGANLDIVEFTGADVAGADLAVNAMEDVTSGGVIGTPSALPADWELIGGYLIGPGANLADADVGGLDLSSADLSDVAAGGITGTPAAMPTGWFLISGYFAGPGADLFDANLAGANLTGIDLAGAGLSGANLTGADLAGDDISGATGGGSDPTTDFSQANLTGADLSGATFANTAANETPYHVNFTTADLADANLTGDQLTGAELTGADLGGATLAGATLTEVSSGGVTGTPAALPADWSFAGGFLLGPIADLTDANLTDVDAPDADLRYAILIGADLQGTNLSQADLFYATTGGNTGTPAALPPGWSMAPGVLLGPGVSVMQATDLSGDDLAGVDLENSQLLDTNMDGANLTGADLVGALLDPPDLVGANLTRADLEGDSLEASDVAGATWSDTICPDGTNSDADAGTCVNDLTGLPVSASPVVVAGTKGTHGWYQSAVTVAWHWFSDGLVGQGCPVQSTTTDIGRSVVLTSSCQSINGQSGTASFAVSVDPTRPVVRVTGVRNGRAYRRGHVPVAGCQTVETVSGVAVRATARVRAKGRHGLGRFIVTCAGAVSVAGLDQAAPVRVTYRVVR